jgi:hypothetical protein
MKARPSFPWEQLRPPETSLMSRFQTAFLALVLAQSAHSAEEYVGRLWESFPPARLVSGLISTDLERGFVLANVALVAFGSGAGPGRSVGGGRVLCRWRGLG